MKVFVADALPWLAVHATYGGRSPPEIRQLWTTGKGEHLAAAIFGNLTDGLHHALHPALVGGDKQHSEIVDPKMLVDDTSSDDFAVSSDLALDHGFDAFRIHISLNCKDASIDLE